MRYISTSLQLTIDQFFFFQKKANGHQWALSQHLYNDQAFNPKKNQPQKSLKKKKKSRNSMTPYLSRFSHQLTFKFYIFLFVLFISSVEPLSLYICFVPFFFLYLPVIVP